MYFAINMPHYPYQGYPKWLEHYKGIKDEKRRLYAAFLSTMDEILKDLLDVVDRDNTIVVLQSDQGHCTHERAYKGGGYTGPYRGAKQSLFEGGVRVPAIISWPGKLPQNEVRSQMVMTCDWYPTLLSLCELPIPEGLEGADITDLMENNSALSPHEAINWFFLESSAIRKGKWKLIINPRDTTHYPWKYMKGIHLYDLESDISEKHNAAAEYPDVVKELHAEHMQWQKEAKDAQVR
jgi:arylsulfatase A-like enzyme